MAEEEPSRIRPLYNSFTRVDNYDQSRVYSYKIFQEKNFDTMGLKIFMLEGVHGVGKTTIMEFIEHSDFARKYGIEGRVEVFTPSVDYMDLPPQSMTKNFKWFAEWFQEINEWAKKKKKNKESATLFTDRCPFTNFYYTHGGYSLCEPIMICFRELKERYGIEFTVVVLERNEISIWKGLKKRCAARSAEYNRMMQEDSRDFLKNRIFEYRLLKKQLDERFFSTVKITYLYTEGLPPESILRSILHLPYEEKIKIEEV